MAQKVDLQERLKMRFLTVDYRDKQETYGTCCSSADTGNIALDVLNIPESVLEELLDLTEPMMQLVGFLNKNRNPHSRSSDKKRKDCGDFGCRIHWNERNSCVTKRPPDHRWALLR